jgi:outer membrane receptor protein involved in Fe transport
MGGREKGTPNTVQPFCKAGVTQTTVGGIPDPTNNCTFDRNLSAQNAPAALLINWPGSATQNYDNLEALVTSLTTHYHFSDLTLTTLTGYYDLNFAQFFDATNSGIGGIWSYQPERDDVLSQEVRLTSDYAGPINFTAGLYYDHTNRSDTYAQLASYLPPSPKTGQLFTWDRNAYNDFETLSGFGQFRYKVVESVELAAGARWTHERKITDLVNSYVNPAAAATYRTQADILQGNFSGNNISPDVSLTWLANSNSTLYAAYKTGYKSGGITNTGALTKVYTPNNIAVKSEIAKGEEIGFKSYFFDRSVSTNITVFNYKYTNLQVSSFYEPTLSFVLQNAAAAQTRGVELNADWRATSQLTFRGSASYDEAYYLSFPNSACFNGQTVTPVGAPLVPGNCQGSVQNLGGKTLPRAPHWGANAGASYDIAVTSRLMLGFNADADFTSKYFTQDNLDPQAYQSSYWLINAGARVYQEGGWELAFIGRNLANKFYVESSLDKTLGAPGQYLAATPRPRELILQATFHF